MSFDRALALARYNWPLYIVCGAASVLGFGLACLSTLNPFLRVVAFIGATGASWYAVACFSAFHAMFDRSELLSGEWLKRCTAHSPRTCVQLSVCVDETTLPIKDVFPHATCTNLDLFDASVMTEPAIAGAKQAANTSTTLQAQPDSLPLADKASEFTLVTLAAHEVRAPTLRKKLFTELARITTLDGRVIIVEPLRNFAAALAFGPGLLHFYPRSEWTRLAKFANLCVESEFNIKPFVHVFVLRHHSQTAPTDHGSAA